MIRTRLHTSWAATFATAAELSRRGYDVTFTLGNTPRIDLLCAVPDGEQFKIQVKGISNRAAFYAQKDFFDTKTRIDLFLVVVLVPKEKNSELQFFILTHKEAQSEFNKMPKLKKDGRPYTSGFGLNWGSVKNYKGKWDSLPTANE